MTRGTMSCFYSSSGALTEEKVYFKEEEQHNDAIAMRTNEYHPHQHP